MSIFRSPAKAPPRFNTIKGRIGPPIPVVEDDEFPIRTPGAGIATPVGEKSQEQSLGIRASTATDRSNLHAGIAANDFTEAASATSLPVQSAEEPCLPRPTQPSALRNSITSGPSGSSIEKPRRGKKSFRSVIGRLFGKKRRDGSISSGDRDTTITASRTDQHRSDTTALSRVRVEDSSQKRSASMPITDYNRALRSHSTTTEDFPQYDAQEANREPIQADGHTRPRRATTPSRLWTPNKAPGYVDWTGLSPRPASSHIRDSRLIIEAEADPSIGMAVTSGSHPNRRSRSLGELREDATMTTVARRRSDEIRYWRESYDPGVLSPMSSNKAETEEPVVLPDESENLEDKENVQPFNFGPMSEMAGMKITQAASLDARVHELEIRMQTLEATVSRLAHSGPSSIIRLQDPPKRSPHRHHSIHSVRPATNNSGNSVPQHEEDRSTLQLRPESHSIRPASYSRPSTVDTNVSSNRSFDASLPPHLKSDIARTLPQETARPLSTSTTVRGNNSSSPTMPKDVFLTAEHYTTLTNMIIAEQSARQHLEDIVHKLQQQFISTIATLQSPSANKIKAALANDAPSGPFSGFEQDSDDEEQYDTDAFKTPNEERESFADDTFGNVMNDEGRRAPRTMSLSQITLKKGAQHV